MYLISATSKAKNYVLALCDRTVIVNNLSTWQESNIAVSELQHASVGDMNAVMGNYAFQTLFVRQIVYFLRANGKEDCGCDSGAGRFSVSMGGRDCVFEVLDFDQFALYGDETQISGRFSYIVSSGGEVLLYDGKALAFQDSRVSSTLRDHLEAMRLWRSSAQRDAVVVGPESRDSPDGLEMSVKQTASLSEAPPFTYAAYERAVYNLTRKPCLCTVGGKKSCGFTRALLSLSRADLTIAHGSATERYEVRQVVANLSFLSVRNHDLFYRYLSDVEQRAQMWKIRRQLEHRDYTEMREDSNAAVEEFDYFRYSRLVIFLCKGDVEIACLLESPGDVEDAFLCFEGREQRLV